LRYIRACEVGAEKRSATESFDEIDFTSTALDSETENGVRIITHYASSWFPSVAEILQEHLRPSSFEGNGATFLAVNYSVINTSASSAAC